MDNTVASDVTFLCGFSMRKCLKIAVFMLGRDSGDWIVVKNPEYTHQ